LVESPKNQSKSKLINPTTSLNTNTNSPKEDQEALETSHKAEDKTEGPTTGPEETMIGQETPKTDPEDNMKTDHPEEIMKTDHQEETIKIDHQEETMKIDRQEETMKTGHQEETIKRGLKEMKEEKTEMKDHKGEKTTTDHTTEILIEEETTTTTDHQEENNKDTNPEEKSSDKELPSAGPRLMKLVLLMTDST
jgi:hypothetical protein